MITLYGISNCDSVRKARKWLDQQQQDYQFHDFRKQGLTRSQLEDWADTLGWETLLNRRGTTWRKLDDPRKANLDRNTAIELMLEQPAMIKRPLLATGNQQLLGFSEAAYQDILAGQK